VKIISGGQTGVDRAALDVALKHGIECGGWCPAGRLDEFGRIPERYPVKELPQNIKEGRSPDRPGALETPKAFASEAAAPWAKPDIFGARTLANVKDSDGTVMIYFAQLRGGTEYTKRCCTELQRVYRLIDAAKISAEEAAKLILDFVRDNNIGILNVAGPRQSDWPDGYGYAFRALDLFLTSVA
jgi:hypothetical protein